jgi:hypothetical protein
MTDNRIAEFLQLAEEEGLTLPYSPETMIAFEDQGMIVDLHTGRIHPGLADAPFADVLPFLEYTVLAVAGG